MSAWKPDHPFCIHCAVCHTLSHHASAICSFMAVVHLLHHCPPLNPLPLCLYVHFCSPCCAHLSPPLPFCSCPLVFMTIWNLCPFAPSRAAHLLLQIFAPSDPSDPSRVAHWFAPSDPSAPSRVAHVVLLTNCTIHVLHAGF